MCSTLLPVDIPVTIMEGAWWSTSCWLVTLVLAMGRVAASCCVPGSLVTLSETNTLPVPCPVSWCDGWLQVCHWMPATILLLAAGLVSCRLLISRPFVTIFCCYTVFSLTDCGCSLLQLFHTCTLAVYADCCGHCFYTHCRQNIAGKHWVRQLCTLACL